MSPLSAAPTFRSRDTIVAVAVLSLAVLLTYANSLHVPFLFDDGPAIASNPSIRTLTTAWAPPVDGSPVTGRPLLNFSFALNYAIGGLDVRHYHAVNLAIHLGAALALFGFARRTLSAPRAPAAWRAHATPLAFALALLWALHPLQTSAVTYVSQRSESLAGGLTLLTLYAFARGSTSRQRRSWHVLAVITCLAGIATKEVAAAAPVLVLLWDRTFLSGTMRAAWRRHGGTHAALLATWVPLALLVASSEHRGRTAGAAAGISVPDYLLTQGGAILHYVRLAGWPHPLIFDYGTAITAWSLTAGLTLVVLILLLGLTTWATLRYPILGFAGCWFFITLAPSSSIVPIATQTMAEHRMYVPLVAVLGLLATATTRWTARPAWWMVVVVTGLALGGGTFRRNADYRSAENLWRITAARRPDNARAHHNLGQALMAAGNPADAAAHFTAALRLEPGHVKARDGLGAARLATGDIAEAISEATRAVQLDPEFVAARINLGAALAHAGRREEAMHEFREALRRDPSAGDANLNLGLLLLESGQPLVAVPLLQRAIAALTGSAQARFALARAHALAGQTDDAIAQFQAGLELAPGDGEAHHRLGLILAQAGRFPAARSELETAVRLQPERAEARANLGNVCLQAGDVAAAIAHYEGALRLNARLPGVRENLETARELAIRTRR